MRLEGSCLCKAVRFGVVSHTPYAYRLCYCERCRKTGGAGGSGVHIMGLWETLEVEGRDRLGVYVAQTTSSPAIALDLHFCRVCASHLFIHADAPGWSHWVYPLAAVIDTPLPRPPEWIHIHTRRAPPWVHVPSGPGHTHFDANTPESIEDWHRRLGLTVD